MIDIIILGPWHQADETKDVWFRPVVDAGRVYGPGEWVVPQHVKPMDRGVICSQRDRRATDDWSRGMGAILLDAAPGSVTGAIPKHVGPEFSLRLARKTDPGAAGTILVTVDACGWRIVRAVRGQQRTVLAFGPQIWTEGNRYAEAAALALGCTLEGGAA